MASGDPETYQFPEIPLDLDLTDPNFTSDLGFDDADLNFNLDFDVEDLFLDPDNGEHYLEEGLAIPPMDLDTKENSSPESCHGSSGLDLCVSHKVKPSDSKCDDGAETGVLKSETSWPTRSPESGCSSEGSFTVCSENPRVSGLPANSSDLEKVSGSAAADCDSGDENGSSGKRKKERGEESVANPRVKSQRRLDSSSSPEGNSVRFTHDEDKKTARLMRNRESSQLSRQRKKHYVEELEEKVRNMNSTITELNTRIACISAENITLRQQLGTIHPQAHVYPPPMAPMGMPWIPYGSYLPGAFGFPPGSQVPVFPIPRLKKHSTVSAPKSKKTSVNSKDDEKKKATKVSKKVASVTFLSFLLFLLYFGGISSVFNVATETNSERLDFIEPTQIEGRTNQRFLRGLADVNGTRNGYFEKCNNMRKEIERLKSSRYDSDCSLLPYCGSKGQVNSTDPLVASLYVPRNDKLVRIDGQLILRSIVATEKSAELMKSKRRGENGLAVPGSSSTAILASLPGEMLARSPGMYHQNRQRALASSTKDGYAENQSKRSGFDGQLQKWFHEGLTGPILGSGMCTEVFQFEVSQNRATIIPTTKAGSANDNDSVSSMIKNRRFLYSTAIPLPGTTLNNGTSEPKDNSNNHSTFSSNTPTSSSSMVVSVLMDPREASDNNGNLMSPPKSISRILVVVLVDSVKYVGYSCMLPVKSTTSTRL